MEGSVSSMDGSIGSTSPSARSGQNIEELRGKIMATKLELESTRAAAKAQAAVHKAKVTQLEEMLLVARRERDEAIQRFMEFQSNMVVCSSSISSCSLAAAASFIADSPLDHHSSLNNDHHDQSAEWFDFPSFDNHSHPRGDDPTAATFAAAAAATTPLLDEENGGGDAGFSMYTMDDFATTKSGVAMDSNAAAGFQQQSPFDLFSSTAAATNTTAAATSILSQNNGSALASILTPLQQHSREMDPSSNTKRLQVDDHASTEMNLNLMLRNLPERGKLLQAVMSTGPLLHTLLLAGPLPQWHHPPPGLDSFQFLASPFPSLIDQQHQHQIQQQFQAVGKPPHSSIAGDARSDKP